MPEDVIDSPVGWVNAHIRAYVESGGRKGHHWRGLPTLLLTTTGRRSGLHRRTALIYGEHGRAQVVVASNGGSREHPLWYRNLLADPAVQVQVGADVIDANARTAVGAEREQLWEQMARIFPTYRRYATRTEREIPVVVLQPMS